MFKFTTTTCYKISNLDSVRKHISNHFGCWIICRFHKYSVKQLLSYQCAKNDNKKKIPYDSEKKPPSGLSSTKNQQHLHLIFRSIYRFIISRYFFLQYIGVVLSTFPNSFSYPWCCSCSHLLQFPLLFNLWQALSF